MTRLACVALFVAAMAAGVVLDRLAFDHYIVRDSIQDCLVEPGVHRVLLSPGTYREEHAIPNAVHR